MSIDASKLPDLIRDRKRQVRTQIGDVERILKDVESELRADVDEIATRHARGEAIIPELDFADIRAGKVSDATKAEIRRRGTAVIRNVFPKSQAEAWNDQIGDYLARNDYVNKAATRDAGDRYFTSLKSSRPQIFGIYWSKPQMEARQAVSMAETRAFLNRLWRFESGGETHFDPHRECTYADRTRRRRPGDHLAEPP